MFERMELRKAVSEASLDCCKLFVPGAVRIRPRGECVSEAGRQAELWRARPRLYRSRCLQVSIDLEALAEI